MATEAPSAARTRLAGARGAEHGQRQRDARDEGLEARVGGDDAPLALLESRSSGEERRDVSVRAEAEQDEVEPGLAELALVLAGRLGRVELAADPVHARRPREPVEERLAGQPVVRALVVRRHAALVAPPGPCAAPVGLAERGELVRAARGRAAGERDLEAG